MQNQYNNIKNNCISETTTVRLLYVWEVSCSSRIREEKDLIIE